MSGALLGPLRGADRPSFQANRGLLSALPTTPTAYMLDPDGHDTNDNAADFSVSASPTPGSSNH